jgi:hypothetical protein
MMSCFPMALREAAQMEDIANSYGDKVANTFVQPIKSMLDAGVRVSYESDGGSYKWADMGIFITRKDSKGKVWGPQDRVDHATMLKMITIWAAEYVLKPDKIGSLEVGKLADLAVLDRDYLTIPDDDVKNVQALLTIMDGKVRFVHTDFANEYNFRPPGVLVSTYKEVMARPSPGRGFN